MGVFTSAPSAKSPLSKPKRKGWNSYAMRAKMRKDWQLLVQENLRLRAENERLAAQTKRLHNENDALWDEIGRLKNQPEA